MAELVSELSCEVIVGQQDSADGIKHRLQVVAEQATSVSELSHIFSLPAIANDVSELAHVCPINIPTSTTLAHLVLIGIGGGGGPDPDPPRLAIISVLSDNVVQVVFNENMRDDTLEVLDNYVFTGDSTLEVASLVLVDDKTVNVTTVQSMINEANYSLFVEELRDYAGNYIDPAYDTMAFIGATQPHLLAADWVDATHIDLEFDQDMAGDELIDPSNYLIGTRSEAPRVLLATSTDDDSELVDVWFSKDIQDLGLTEEVNYTVQTFTPPKVIRATCEDDAAHVVVEFDKEIPDTHLLDIDNYVLYGNEVDYPDVVVPHAPKIQSAVWERSDSLLVTFSEVVTDLTAEDVDNYVLYGREVYGFYIVSATQVDTTHIDVVFSSIPDETSAETTTNYVISGAGTPTVSAAELLAAKPNIVRLTVPFTVSGTYTVTVSNVTSIRSETLNLSQKSATWTHGMIISVHASLPTNLHSYWSFNSDANDLVGTHHGTLVNSPTNIAAKLSNGYNLSDTSSQYISVAHHADFNTQTFSYSMWYKPTSIDVTVPGTLIAKRNVDASRQSFVYAHAQSATPYTYFAVWTSTGDFTVMGTQPVVGEWCHAVIVCSGTTIKLYENGVLKNTTAITGTVNYITDDLLFGRMVASPHHNYFDGVIDEYGFWNRTLTAAEIYCLYNGGNGIAY